jgi:hypothetical protein
MTVEATSAVTRKENLVEIRIPERTINKEYRIHVIGRSGPQEKFAEKR